MYSTEVRRKDYYINQKKKKSFIFETFFRKNYNS